MPTLAGEAADGPGGPPGDLATVLMDGLDDDEHRRTRIAWLYYVEGQTQAEIALRLGISRIKVVRDLAACRESGLVQIRINGRLAGCVRLERALEARFGLGEAIVVPTPRRASDIPPALGIAAGAWLSDRLRPGMTVGIGWGRTMHWSVRSVRRPGLRGLTVVSLLGGIDRGSAINTYETASRLAEALGAQCYYLAAPTFASRPELRDMLLDQTGVRDACERARAAQLVLVSVGSLAPGSTNRHLGLITDAEVAELEACGAVGDLLGHFLDRDGGIVDHPLNRRVVGLAPGDLARTPVCLLASGGEDKVPVLAGALRAGYANCLLTDERTAASLVEHG